MNKSFLIFVIVILPILSVCLGFTVHYVVRPMVDSLVDALHALARIMGTGNEDSRMARLEAEIDQLRGEVSRLLAASDSVPPVHDHTSDLHRLPRANP